MRCLLSLLVLAAAFSPLSLSAKDKKAPPITIRLHGEGNAREGESFVSEVELIQSKRKLTIRKVPVVNERDIKAFYPFPGRDGLAGSYFQLDSHGSNKLMQFTTESKGQLAVILINGRVAAALRVDKEVRDGILFVPGGLLPNEIAELRLKFPILGREEEFKKKPPKPEKKPREEKATPA